VQAQSVTVNVKDIPLVEVLKTVQKQTPYTFIYNNTLIDVNKRVTITATKEEIVPFLNRLLSGTDIVFKIVEKQITLSPKEFVSEKPAPGGQAAGKTTKDQEITVRGTILDNRGDALAGATVRLGGTQTGIFSNQDGIFEINVPSESSVLIFSYIGYVPLEVTVGKQRALKVILQDQQNVLDELIVTGYQTISKDRSSGAYSRPNAIIVEDRSSSTSVLQRLEGLVPGFAINLTQGSQPSSTNRMLTGEGSANQYIIRGIGSVQSDRAPLYVVNGIILDDISSLNANDVENITVLKDATASSIWGSRAANGVIVITTKRGMQNDKVKVSYDAFINMQGKPDYNYFPTMSSADFIKTAREVFDPLVNTWANVSTFTNSNAGTIMAPHERILYDLNRGLLSASQADAKLDSLSAISNSKQIGDLFYRPQTLMNQTVSLSGGTKSYSFYGSISHTNNQSSTPGEKNTQFSVNIRQDLTLNDRLKMFVITDLANNISSNRRSISIDNRFLPYQLFKDESGKSIDMSYLSYVITPELKKTFEDQSKVNLNYSPIDEFERGETKSDGLLARVTTGVSYKIVEGLRFEGTYGYNKGSNKTTSFDDETSFMVRSSLVNFTQAAVAPSTIPTYYLPNTGGQLSTSNTVQRQWTVRNQFVFDKAFNDMKHQLTLLFGQEAQERFYSTISSSVYGYDPLLLTYQNVDYKALATTGVSAPVAARNTSNRSILPSNMFSENESLTRVTSFYATGGYTYKSKYTVNGSWRRDESNLFGTDKSAQKRPVWSMGAKWQIGKESFITKLGWINSLDLRVSYGITGNAPTPGSATSYDVLTPTTSTFAPGPGLNISTYANRALTWERTENINIGIDFGILNRRVSGTIDIYQRNTTDMIGQLPTNLLSGPANIVGNFGDMYNRGIELSLNTVNIITKDFSWNTTLNLAYNVNKITKLQQVTAVSDLSRLVQQTKYYEGYPALSIFAYNWAGLDNMGDPQIFLPDGTLYKASLTSGLSVDGAKYMGSFQPVWNGALLNFVRYKNFNLSSSIIFNMGHYGRRDALQHLSGGRLTPTRLSFSQGYPSFQSGNVNAEILDRWKKPGDELITDVPAYITTNTSRRNTAYYVFGSNNVYNASYIKMRDITLSYSLPKSVLKIIKMDDVRLRVQVANLMLWKANKFGLDPEYQITDINYTMERRLPVGQGAVTIGVNIKF
jgi:TonB-linked SusC/RagA family outer membrane protein